MAKMTICKGCGATMDKRAKSCPQCGRKNKKPVRFIVTGVIVYVIIMIVIVGNIAKRNEKEEDSYSTYRWPSNGIAALLPEPDAEYGEITNESKDSFAIDLYHMSKNDFEDYIEACKEEGFSVDYNKTSSSYYADDRNGNSLSIWYDEDDEEMTIRIMAAVDVIDEDRGTDEIADNNTGNNTDNNTVTSDQEEDTADNTEITDAAETGSETEETETDETENSDSQNTENVEFREWVDSYEAFMNEYIDFMKNYESTDISMLARYSELMSTYTEFLNATNSLKEDDYSVSDWAYYMEAYVRIMNRLSAIQ